MIDWWEPVIFEYYGASEGNGLTAITSQEWLEHKGSVGKAFLGTIHSIYVDEEEYLYLTDLKDFTIISGGVNIYPQEIEDCLINHPQDQWGAFARNSLVVALQLIKPEYLSRRTGDEFSSPVGCKLGVRRCIRIVSSGITLLIK